MVKVQKSEAGEMEVGIGPFKVTLSGRLAKQAMTAMAAASLFWFGWNQMMVTLQGVKYDVVKTNIEIQAMIDEMPAGQQISVKRNIAEKMVVLKMAEAAGGKGQ